MNTTCRKTMHMGMMHTGSTVIPYTKSTSFITEKGCIYCMVWTESLIYCSRYRPGVVQRVGRGIALLFYDRSTRKGWVVSSMPRPQFTPDKDLVPIYRRLGGPLGRSGRAENLVPTGIQSRTVQPVVSRYTDWATRPTMRILPFVIPNKGV
jgi:hypothetical protein